MIGSTKSILRISALCLASLSLSACLGGGGGGGGGGGAGGGGGGGGGGGSIDAQFDAFDTAFGKATGKAPTSNMPTGGTASYSGEVQVDLVDNRGDDIGKMIGDTDLTVAFARPTDRNTTARVTNIRGVDENGDRVSWDGRLTSQYWEDETGGSAGGVSVSTIQLPAIAGGGTARTGAISVTVAGKVSQDDTDLFDDRTEVSLSLGGAFFGNRGETIAGPALLNVWKNGAPNQAGGSGTHYANKD